MKRKVVQQGPATLMVSLPSKWAKENNVNRGDDIEVAEEKGKLVLIAGNGNSRGAGTAKKEFDSRDFGIFTEHFVNYFYQKGYDEITIRYDDSKYADLIEKRVRQLVGLEVVDKGKNYTTIKTVMKIDEQEFETVLKKLFQITLVMGDKIAEALERNNTALLQEAQADEKENNKYCDLCLRVLYKNQYKYPENGFVLFALIRDLEHVGDQYKYLAEDFLNSKRPNAESLALFKRIRSFFRLYYELYYQYDKEKAIRFFLEKEELMAQCVAKAESNGMLAAHLTGIVQSVFNLKSHLFLMKV